MTGFLTLLSQPLQHGIHLLTCLGLLPLGWEQDVYFIECVCLLAALAYAKYLETLEQSDMGALGTQ